jgi:hypothetical protein
MRRKHRSEERTTAQSDESDPQSTVAVASCDISFWPSSKQVLTQLAPERIIVAVIDSTPSGLKVAQLYKELEQQFMDLMNPPSTATHTGGTKEAWTIDQIIKPSGPKAHGDQSQSAAAPHAIPHAADDADSSCGTTLLPTTNSAE